MENKKDRMNNIDGDFCVTITDARPKPDVDEDSIFVILDRTFLNIARLA